MKRILAILLALVVTAFALSGCAGTAMPAAEPGSDTAVVTPGDEVTSDNDAMPDNASPTDVQSADGRGSRRGKMVIGRVKSIVGNSVELELAEIDEEQMARLTPPQGREAPSDTPDPSRTPDPNRSGQRGSGGTPPEGFTPGERPGAGQGSSGNSTGGSSSASKLDLSYTGETAAYLLPVGMQIGTGDYTAIKTGMVLRLMLNEEDEVISASIISS